MQEPKCVRAPIKCALSCSCALQQRIEASVDGLMHVANHDTRVRSDLGA